MSSKLRRFILPVVILVVVLVGLRTCVMLLYFMGDNFYAGVGDVGASELAKYTDATQSADRTPQWSSDGQTIVVNIGDYIYAVSAGGDEFWRIPKKTSADRKYGEYSPSLSPDGRVAYRLYLEEDSIGFFELITDDEGNYIESAKLDGSDVKRVAYTGKLVSNPVFSPDGSRIAFLAPDQGFTTMSIDGSDTHHFTREIKTGNMSWSNDSQRIAYRTGPDDGNYHTISTVRWDGTDERTVAKIHARGSLGRVYKPEWSRTGNRIYFAKREQLKDTSFVTANGLYYVDLARPDLQKIADLGEGFRSSFVTADGIKVSPSGAELLFVNPFDPSRTVDSGQDEIYLINTDGTDLRKIADSEGRFAGEKLFDGENESHTTQMHVSWSPDGERISVHKIYNPGAGGWSYGTSFSVLFTMARDGSDARKLISSSSEELPVLGHNELMPTVEPAVTE